MDFRAASISFGSRKGLSKEVKWKLHHSAARVEQSHGAKVDLFVAAQGRFYGASVFGKGRRIEDYRVEALSGVVVISDLVEDVCLDEFDIGDAVELGIQSGALDRRSRDIEGRDVFASFSHVQSE